ncbi:hypothetical protein C8F04DRAFT_1241608 [Mycena alexandri]|uniref:Uncharacterized protein n=1 Tax=Mycena alexandri TaxID=1745969 RepID=A0AAD6S5P8_9AGAR|nr:hypothetical protein C8F04DRAFT_1241608 [Mycena alexandri]
MGNARWRVFGFLHDTVAGVQMLPTPGTSTRFVADSGAKKKGHSCIYTVNRVSLELRGRIPYRKCPSPAIQMLLFGEIRRAERQAEPGRRGCKERTSYNGGKEVASTQISQADDLNRCVKISRLPTGGIRCPRLVGAICSERGGWWSWWSLTESARTDECGRDLVTWVGRWHSLKLAEAEAQLVPEEAGAERRTSRKPLTPESCVRLNLHEARGV